MHTPRYTLHEVHDTDCVKGCVLGTDDNVYTGVVHWIGYIYRLFKGLVLDTVYDVYIRGRRCTRYMLQTDAGDLDWVQVLMQTYNGTHGMRCTNPGFPRGGCQDS